MQFTVYRNYNTGVKPMTVKQKQESIIFV